MTSKVVKAQFVFAGILLLLGAGNLFFAQHKADYYRELLELESGKEVSFLEANRGTEVSPTSQFSDDKRSYVEGRHAFYRFCILGGKVLLAFAGVLLCSALVTRWLQSEQMDGED